MDDRGAGEVPGPELDPHRPFVAEGVYQQGQHGALPTIPWYSVVGNHDVFAVGVFPIIEVFEGQRIGLLPLYLRPG